MTWDSAYEVTESEYEIKMQINSNHVSYIICKVRQLEITLLLKDYCPDKQTGSKFQ